MEASRAVQASSLTPPLDLSSGVDLLLQPNAAEDKEPLHVSSDSHNH